jgi:hypothetical protein
VETEEAKPVLLKGNKAVPIKYGSCPQDMKLDEVCKQEQEFK